MGLPYPGGANNKQRYPLTPLQKMVSMNVRKHFLSTVHSDQVKQLNKREFWQLYRGKILSFDQSNEGILFHSKNALMLAA